MNERVQIGDPYELAIAFWRHLGRADQCRIIDAMLCELGGCAPIAQTEDIRGDAVWWMQSVPDEVKRVYLVELWGELPPARQSGFLTWAAKNKKEAQKAETPGG